MVPFYNITTILTGWYTTDGAIDGIVSINLFSKLCHFGSELLFENHLLSVFQFFYCNDIVSTAAPDMNSFSMFSLLQKATL